MTSISPPEGQDKTLLELATRCEAATGPDRELDELISAAVEGAVREVQSDGRTAYHTIDGSRWVSIRVPDPGYTASLDAAMTLVPEGFRLFCLGEARYMTRNPAYSAQLEIWTSKDGVDGSDRRSIGVANTAALALCAAALRALNQVRAIL